MFANMNLNIKDKTYSLNRRRKIGPVPELKTKLSDWAKVLTARWVEVVGCLECGQISLASNSKANDLNEAICSQVGCTLLC